MWTITDINLKYILPIVVGWALFLMFWGDGQECECIFGYKGDKKQCEYATGICSEIVLLIANGTTARHVICDKLVKRTRVISSPNFPPCIIAKENDNKLHYYSNDFTEVYTYSYKLLLITLLAYITFMYAYLRLITEGKSGLTTYLRDRLYPIPTVLSRVAKRRVFLNQVKFFASYGWTIWLKQLGSASVLLCLILIMKVYTGEGILQCLWSWSKSFTEDVTRWRRTDSFYLRFPGVLDCRLNAALNASMGYPVEDDHSKYDTLCHIPLNRYFEILFRGLYIWTIIVVCSMMYKAFSFVLMVYSYKFRSYVFTKLFKSQVLLRFLNGHTIPENIAASEILFLIDLQYVVEDTSDFNDFILAFVENSYRNNNLLGTGTPQLQLPEPEPTPRMVDLFHQ
ncbi:unnamed protein product [Orchesella dallaii]|uniref:Innexin n=1 Tax=Orchesella dallaii TaxID=48710 RepID=A0ABP1QP41_9HEXA